MRAKLWINEINMERNSAIFIEELYIILSLKLEKSMVILKNLK